MRRPLVAGNWKMNGSSAFAKAFVASLLDALPTPVPADAPELALFPPSVYLGQVVAQLRNSGIAVGVQNVHPESSGAFTGEIAPDMVRDLGADLALVGHSERRQLFAEDDELVVAKFLAVQRAGLTPVLCVGETLAQRDGGVAERTVLSQLEVVLERAGAAAFADAVVAYEPVWAIGTGRTATPEDAQAMHAAIRGRVAETDETIAEGLRILYGGSVNAANASTLFAQPDVDGGLVGGASLDPEQFAHLYEAAQA
ncbi:MAG: triose-phosphate isomerase [Gammaproteobacteria bacterium]|nr:MAG: triose-phosphate isomerase [Gammaproteobacteria bacterium]